MYPCNVTCFFQIERLRKEGNRILEEAQEKLREDLKKKVNLNTVVIDSDSDSQDAATAKLKVGSSRNYTSRLEGGLVCNAKTSHIFFQKKSNSKLLFSWHTLTLVMAYTLNKN